MVFEQQQRGRRVNAQHRCLHQVCSGRDRDRVGFANAARLRPILPLQVDDEIAGLETHDSRPDRAHPPDAFRAGGRRELGGKAVTAAAERQIGRIDRKGEHVEDDLSRTGLSNVRDLDNACDLFRRAIRANLDPFHDTLAVLRRGASSGPNVGIETRRACGFGSLPQHRHRPGSIRGSWADPSMRSASASRSSAVCSRASQIIGLTVRSAKSRYHDASSRSFDEFGMSARLVARIKLRIAIPDGKPCH